MAIAPIGGGVPPVAPQPQASATSGPAKAGADFGTSLEAVAQLEAKADALGTQIATGQLSDVHDFMAAAAKASLGVQLTVAIRNRAVEAYQEIMRMQV